ncbi:hypothetical protein PFLUV_G00185240 [Perca fluviatilis]|uniref:Uncharacterized protein n=1 Tax=Perca fluviatilis TaxID=8168 RepID=A0A6A5EGK5_PERFL|nr:hypothetical protein PFLUV_G00185240 [Perca fluviatilis]
MGLKGSPNFTDLRTAVFAHAKNNLPAAAGRLVATLMCNNTATADCFYALSLNVAQSKRMREHFRQALTHTMQSPPPPGRGPASLSTPPVLRTKPLSPTRSQGPQDWRSRGSSCEAAKYTREGPQYGRLMLALAQPQGQHIAWHNRLAAPTHTHTRT